MSLCAAKTRQRPKDQVSHVNTEKSNDDGRGLIIQIDTTTKKKTRQLRTRARTHTVLLLTYYDNYQLMHLVLQSGFFSLTPWLLNFQTKVYEDKFTPFFLIDLTKCFPHEQKADFKKSL